MTRGSTDDGDHGIAPPSLSSSASAWTEAKLLLDLALPTVVVQLSDTFPPALVASYVGRRLGNVALDGFSLGIIAINVICLAILQGLLSASDTLSPQAFGAGNHRELGLIAVRAVLVGLASAAPLNGAASAALEPVLVRLGEDPDVSKLAAGWYRIYLLAMPFYVLFQSTWKFLQAQSVMAPLVVVCVVSCAVVLPACLILVPTMGFLGSAMAMLAFQASRALLLLLYLGWRRPHRPETWPGLGAALREALGGRGGSALRTFLSLGLGGALASTEWWYWEILCGLVGTFGVVPLSVHTVPNQVIAVSFMIPLGIGIALSTRLGNTISSDVERAKRLVAWCYVVGLAFMLMLSLALYFCRRAIFAMFTEDPDVIEGCERIWFHVSLFLFNLSIYAFNMGTMNGLGMQWALGRATVMFTWVIGLPLAYYVSVERGGGLDALWVWAINPPYAGMNVVLCFSFMTAHWHEISAKVKEREGVDESRIGLPLSQQTYGSVDEVGKEIQLAEHGARRRSCSPLTDEKTIDSGLA